MSTVSRDKIDSLIQESWKRLLKVQSVRPDDDFFELGGHSLQAVRMIKDVGQALGVAPDLRRFEGRTTPAQVAATFREIAGGS
jgi:acyl carrier protein